VIDRLPVNRSITDVALLAPGTTKGDSDFGNLPSFGGATVGENAYYLNAKNYQRAPGIVDKDRQDILDHSEVYSGVYGRACISFFAYNKNGNKGIGCSLHHLQKGRDGDPLGGFTRAEDEFDDGEEDFLS